MTRRQWLGIGAAWVLSCAGTYWVARTPAAAPVPSEERALFERLEQLEARLGASALAPALAQASCPRVAPSAAPSGRSEAAAPEAKAADEPNLAEPSPEQQAALDRSNTIVDDAIRAGHWGDAEVQALRVSMVGLPGAQQAQIAQKLFAAINRNRVRADLHGPPL
jgi:hypothetical protein